jgi:uncharacterized membrane protein YfcA
MNWPLIVIALAAAGFTQGLTGFGFGLISMSLLPLAMGDIKRAAALSTIYGLLVTIGTFLRHYREYKWRLGWTFFLGSCVGVPIGVYFLEKADPVVLLKILGVVLVAFAAREFLVKKPLQSISAPLAVPFGVFSGSLSGAFNLGGIPTATFAYAHSWTKGQIMAFLQVMIMTNCLIRLLLYNKFGYFKEFSWTWGLAVLIPLFAAMIAGHWLMGKIPAQQMRRSIFVFIGLAGFYYLFIH